MSTRDLQIVPDQLMRSTAPGIGDPINSIKKLNVISTMVASGEHAYPDWQEITGGGRKTQLFMSAWLRVL
jgi:hypothetical protein